MTEHWEPRSVLVLGTTNDKTESRDPGAPEVEYGWHGP